MIQGQKEWMCVLVWKNTMEVCEGMEVEIDVEWVPTRIEMDCSDSQWYLVGMKADELQGLKVRL